ncbi:MAG TPA: tRNA preQ1(34) S-adenosylmethionine ribosyltransferase-isomerase QueA [Candidatus Izemoplasmatales bacterium]|nr:tRNA preQ1(34) S-adenosylmethionine ribosyltransferase-isomerase QueA [Bacillota bacterium]HRY77631.1 tRNA preQ1(34) S-adenosylmethionine ribosyltransferase-isomerase QueA [Candidatus Izemoplasmatales bacterium]
MKTADFDYVLPEELIAQTPIPERSSSRLLVCDRDSFTLVHDHFYNLPRYLHPGDVLVINDTKVLPARLLGVKEDTGAVIEVLLLRNLEGDRWETLVKPARRVRKGTVIVFGDGLLKARCVAVAEEGLREFVFAYEGIFLELLDRLGEMPLPPYIHETLADKDRYQTVYSAVVGSAAAPTAGLHFTQPLLSQLRELGVLVCPITLHVGLGTFRPVNVEDVTKHRMHSEYYHMSQTTADILNAARADKRSIIAVGTTSIRTLETLAAKEEKFRESSGWTDIFIYPGFAFRAVDGLITNFHLPKSTLLMLVSAFASPEIIRNAYDEAIKERYRFFSFGDSMFLRPKGR